MVVGVPDDAVTVLDEFAVLDRSGLTRRDLAVWNLVVLLRRGRPHAAPAARTGRSSPDEWSTWQPGYAPGDEYSSREGTAHA